jgi:hypothetical protein
MSHAIQDAIARLRDFRARKDAIRRIVAAGPDAVEPVINALETERNTGARWALVNILGQIADRRAVPVLAQCLDEADYREVAFSALKRITGEDRGYAPQAWLGLEKEPEPAPETGAAAAAPDAAAPAAPPSSPLAPDETVRLAVQHLDAALQQLDEDDFELDVRLADERRQTVRVAFGKRDHEGTRIVIVYTECGPADPELYETVLRKNMQMPYGAIAIRDIHGKPTFVMFNSMLLEGLTPLALHKSVEILAERADRIERILSKGGDKR